MPTEKRSIGLLSIEVGAIAVDGGMSIALASLGVTYQDSAELSQGEPEIIEIYSEENDEPEEIITGKSVKMLKWSIMNVSATSLAATLGGTVTGTGATEAWEAPSATTLIEKSVRVKTKSGETIDMPRCRIVSKLAWKFSKKDVNKVDITAYVLVPTKVATAPIKKYITA